MLRAMKPLILLLLLYSFTQSQQLSKTIEWQPTGEKFDRIVSDGRPIRIIKNESLIIAVYLNDDSDYYIAEVTVFNDSAERFDLDPMTFAVLLRDKKGKEIYLAPIPPSKIAGKYKSRAKWGTFFRSLSLSTTTSQSNERGNVAVYNNGQMATGTYSSTTTTTAPNVVARQAANEANRRAFEDAAVNAEIIMSTSMKANTVFPQTYISGLVYFPRKKFTEGALFININHVDYVFRFAPAK